MDKYKDQYIELTGKLGTIDSEGDYISCMPMEDEWAIMGVTCYIQNDDQLSEVKKMKADDRIVVKGKITKVGEVLGYSMDIDSIEPAQ